MAQSYWSETMATISIGNRLNLICRIEQIFISIFINCQDYSKSSLDVSTENVFFSVVNVSC